MTSEERIHKFLSEPIRVEDFRTALINLLNEHAAEQRQMCADAIVDRVKPITLHSDVINACLNATGENDDK